MMKNPLVDLSFDLHAMDPFEPLELAAQFVEAHKQAKVPWTTCLKR